MQRAIDELAGKGYTEDQVRSGGLRITTTVRKQRRGRRDQRGAHRHAGRAAATCGRRWSPSTRGPVASLAYYGGEKAYGAGAIDYAQAHRQPGSSMKPYTLATGLEQGISVERDPQRQLAPDVPGRPEDLATPARRRAPPAP